MLRMEKSYEEFVPCWGWKNLQRICLKTKDYNSPCRVEEVNFENCPNIKVLKLVGLDMKDVKLELSTLKHMESLEFDFGIYIEYAWLVVDGFGLLKNLVELHWSNFGNQAPYVEEIGNMTNLHVLVLEHWNLTEKQCKMPNLEKLTKLRDVSLQVFRVDTIVCG